VNLILNIAQQRYHSGCILSIMSHRTMLMVTILSAGATLLHAQAMVEFGTLSGRAAGASGGANVGKSIVDVFGKVNQQLSGAATVDAAAKPKPLTAVPAVATAKPPEPAIPPDLSGLLIGMDRADMLKKVGKPSMSITSVEDATQIETCWYRSGSTSVTVTLREEKVATISAAENLPAKQALAPVSDSLSH
jgi:hypothetical protein